MQLSKNFWLKEMLRSERAARLGRKVDAPPHIVANLKYGCEKVLQPIRDGLCSFYGKEMPLVVTSAYRPMWLNKLVGGSSKSDHMKGLGFDVGCPYLTDFEFAEFIRDRHIELLPIKDLGLEFDQWIHIGVAAPDDEPDREVWTARKQMVKGVLKTVYLSGLVKEK